MVGIHLEKRQIKSIVLHGFGLVAMLLGAGLLLVYAFAPAEIVPGSQPNPPGGVEPAVPFVVYCSGIGGPILFTWGILTYRYQTSRPLTSRRAIIAPGLSVLGLLAGVGRFTYEWTTDMPFEVVEAQPGGSDASRTVDWPMHMIVQMDLGAAHFASLAASSMVVIGAIAAQRGWRRAAKSALVPAAILGFDIAWTAAVSSALESSVLTVLIGVPFAVGYLGTRSE